MADSLIDSDMRKLLKNMIFLKNHNDGIPKVKHYF